jgi:hypothetical protein|tara:strand:+ start:157 stop:423 length:267 start_codon:yes stop_codon:yes gene_type:complete
MKLTKQRLKEIIKEEVSTMSENAAWDTDPEEEAEQRVEAIENELEHLLGKMDINEQTEKLVAYITSKMDIDEKEELVAYITSNYLHWK